MTDRLYKKIAKVTVWRESVPSSANEYVVKRLSTNSTVEISDLRLSFKVEHSLTKTPNTCDVYIHNLARDWRSDLNVLPLSVELQAGYDEVPHLLYTGNLRYGMTEQPGVTSKTLLLLGDGDRVYAHARHSRSYRPGTTYRTVLRDIARSMGLALPAAMTGDPNLDRQFTNGTVAHGFARDELSRALAPFGYTWSIQNGALVVLSEDQVLAGEAALIDEEHGMVDVPVFGTPPRSGKAPHVTVKSLLYPGLRPGGLAQVTSRDLKGLFRIEKVTHQGDTHSNQWHTTLEIKPR